MREWLSVEDNNDDDDDDEPPPFPGRRTRRRRRRKLRTVTWNLWNVEEQWPARRDAIAATLRALRPDVVAVQEVRRCEALRAHDELRPGAGGAAEAECRRHGRTILEDLAAAAGMYAPEQVVYQPAGPPRGSSRRRRGGGGGGGSGGGGGGGGMGARTKRLRGGNGGGGGG